MCRTTTIAAITITITTTATAVLTVTAVAAAFVVVAVLNLNRAESLEELAVVETGDLESFKPTGRVEDAKDRWAFVNTLDAADLLASELSIIECLQCFVVLVVDATQRLSCRLLASTQ